LASPVGSLDPIVHNVAEVSSFAVPAITLKVLPSTKMLPSAKKTAPSGRLFER
jgi:hypothetical protein